MKVSVSMITYNHEPYIAQAIDSVLMQQTNFPFEIIIGEDDSADNTRAIVKEYKKRYPDKIRLFLNDRKNVIYIDGKPTGQWNFANNLKHAKGEYIALLEGDDFWTSPHKLQKQVDFLDARPDFAICFHNAEKVFVDGRQQSKLYCPPEQKEISTLEDLVVGNFIPTCSVVFRRGLFGELPAWFYEVPVGDWPLHVLNAQHGCIGYLNEAMAVYRVHSSGAWSGKSPADVFRTMLKIYGYLNAYLGYRYEDMIRRAELTQLKYFVSKLRAEAIRRDSIDEIVDDLQDTLSSWPSEHKVPRVVYSQALGDLYSGLVFAGHKAGRRRIVRECLPKAVRYRPALLANRGVWSIAVAAFLGQQLADRVRRHPQNSLQP